MGDHNDVVYMIEATSPCGTVIRTGPVDVGTGVLLVDGHLAPHGWAPRFLPVMPVDRALGIVNAASRRNPVPESDLFIKLRNAVLADQDNDGVGCPRAGALLAHLAAHRPLQMWTGDEECRLAECDHTRLPAGMCSELVSAGRICLACSAVYDSGSEWGPEWLDACRIEWPCPPIRATTTYYRITLPGQDARRG